VSVYPAEVDKSIYNLHSSLKPVEIACWHSHFEVFREIADGDDDVAIIFEDDIDMEWDLERRLRYIWPFLPDGWDQVMIGMLIIHPLIMSVYML
jgi:GR25 family glycosyltransferase involved in LPS biosynthesis